MSLGSHYTGVTSLKIQRLHAEGASRLARGFLKLAGADETTTRRGIAAHEKHSLERSTCSKPRSDQSIILRGTLIHTQQEIALSRGVAGVKSWGSFVEMRQETVEAVERHFGELYTLQKK